MANGTNPVIDEQNRTAFIKNIPYDVDEEFLSAWCSTFGPIVKCDLKRDKYGQSRGFAFITFASVSGLNNILSKRPHQCYGRSLLVRTANIRQDSPSPPRNRMVDSVTTGNENTFNVANDESSRLASVCDELEANLECVQIAHQREIEVLRKALEREKKRLDDAQQLFNEADEDCRVARNENLRHRTNLIKNVMQTHNIRSHLARMTKNEMMKRMEIEKKCDEILAKQNKSMPNSKAKPRDLIQSTKLSNGE